MIDTLFINSVENAEKLINTNINTNTNTNKCKSFTYFNEFTGKLISDTQ